MTTAKPKNEPDYTAMGRLDLYAKAKDDHRAMKEAKQKGEPIPATPALDELQRRQAEMTNTRKSTTKAGTRSKGRTDIRYFHDGMSMSEGHKSKLSTVAYFYSFDLDGDKKRVGTSEFKAALVKAGVTDPGAPGWMVKLPNGVTIECRLDKEKSRFSGEPHKRTATKATAPKSPAKVSKPVAKKTPSQKAREAAAPKPVAKATTKVTPIAKGQPKKKSAPKKAMQRTA